MTHFAHFVAKMGAEVEHCRGYVRFGPNAYWRCTMTLGEFLEYAKELPPETILSIAELGEAFGLNIAGVEIVEDAHVDTQDANGKEAIELANGTERVIVLRT